MDPNSQVQRSIRPPIARNRTAIIHVRGSIPIHSIRYWAQVTIMQRHKIDNYAADIKKGKRIDAMRFVMIPLGYRHYGRLFPWISQSIDIKTPSLGAPSTLPRRIPIIIGIILPGESLYQYTFNRILRLRNLQSASEYLCRGPLVVAAGYKVTIMINILDLETVHELIELHGYRSDVTPIGASTIWNYRLASSECFRARCRVFQLRCMSLACGPSHRTSKFLRDPTWSESKKDDIREFQFYSS